MRIRSWQVSGVVAYGLLIGMGLGRFATGTVILIMLSATILLLVVVQKSRLYTRLVIIAVLSICVGSWRAITTISAQKALTSQIGSTVELKGVVYTDPSSLVDGDKRIVLHQVELENGVRVGGRVASRTSTTELVRRGDTVWMDGQLSAGTGSAVAMYDAHISKLLPTSTQDWGIRVRDWFSKRLRVVLPEPHASLALGYLVGQSSDLPEDLVLDLRQTGLTHIIVASGYNLSILVLFSKKMLHRISRYVATIGSLGLVIGFVSVGGLSPSLMRAAIVSAMTVIAWYFARRAAPVLILGIAAAATAFYDPFLLWGDVGWYLSFMSFGGVLILAPVIERYFFSDRRISLILSVLIESLSATVLTLPYSIFVFGKVSVVALFANIAVVPLIAPVMFGSFASGLLSGAIPLLSGLFSFVVKYLLDVQLFFIHFLARRDPGLELEGLPMWIMLLVYLIMIVGIWHMHRMTKPRYIEAQQGT